MKTDALVPEKPPEMPTRTRPAVADERVALEPMDPRLTSIQPGSGVVMRLELAWGRLRRRYLKAIRPRYVLRMQQLRRGDFNGCPHEALDPRDVKFYRNQGGYYWDPADDPFAWRDRLPFVRVGLAELFVLAGGFFAAAGFFAVLAARFTMPRGLSVTLVVLAILAAVVGALVIWFFRNPRRLPPAGAGLLVAPADGTVVEIADVADEEFVGGSAVRIGIFLSIFDVHINRVPTTCRVIGVHYRPGKMLNALRPQSARENEQLSVHIHSESSPRRRMVVRQITGAFARRIVCWLRPGDLLVAGERFGMIKLGSRTELVIPREPGLEIVVRRGDKVRAGTTVVARYTESASGGNGL